MAGARAGALAAPSSSKPRGRLSPSIVLAVAHAPILPRAARNRNRIQAQTCPRILWITLWKTRGRGAIPLQIRSRFSVWPNFRQNRATAVVIAKHFRGIKGKFLESLTESTRFCDGHSGVEKSSRDCAQSGAVEATPPPAHRRSARPGAARRRWQMSCPVRPGASRMKPSAAAISPGDRRRARAPSPPAGRRNAPPTGAPRAASGRARCAFTRTSGASPCAAVRVSAQSPILAIV